MGADGQARVPGTSGAGFCSDRRGSGQLAGRAFQWEAFLDACDVFAKLPVVTVAGNHEVHSNYTYQKLFALPDDAEEDQSGESFIRWISGMCGC